MLVKTADGSARRILSWTASTTDGWESCQSANRQGLVGLERFTLSTSMIQLFAMTPTSINSVDKVSVSFILGGSWGWVISGV